MKIGDRIINIHTGECGHIDEIEDDWIGMRCLTPDNVPSCCVSWGPAKSFQQIPESVLPMPRSKEWKRKSKEFCDFVAEAIRSVDV